TGNESSSYSRDVAQVLARACMNCHGARQQRANFSMLSFELLLRGGDSGAVIVPGKPTESLLIKKLKGTAGERMPRRMPAFDEETIKKIEQWIADGAKYDGGDPKIQTPRLAALYSARHSTHKQLSENRVKIADANWRLSLPGDENKPNILETDDFLLYGTVSTADLKSIAALATEQAAKVAAALKADMSRPLVKGRITLYVYRQRYHYSEFGQMVEKRQLPRDWRGHWGYTTTDAYICIVPPRQDEYSLKGLLAQQLAGTYVASQGTDVPRWFAEGSARVVAAKLDPRDGRIRQWNKRLAGVLADSPKPGAFLSGGLPPEEADIVSYGFVKAMKPSSRKYQKLLDSLREGKSFEQAFMEVYRRRPIDLARAWAGR
ncbi:MAG: hypothetical protein IID54_06220, partial [Proteobacteria bacterium]|nr:hypothetical protein [Pseudomonadota bacterium]